MNQAGKSFGLMKRVSLLEDQVSDLMAKIIHLESLRVHLPYQGGRNVMKIISISWILT
jgi:hypothetical protein